MSIKKILPLLALAAFIFSCAGAQGTEWWRNKTLVKVEWQGVVGEAATKLDSIAQEYIGKPFNDDTWVALQFKVLETGLYDNDFSVEYADAGKDQKELILKVTVKAKESPLLNKNKATAS